MKSHRNEAKSSVEQLEETFEEKPDIDFPISAQIIWDYMWDFSQLYTDEHLQCLNRILHSTREDL